MQRQTKTSDDLTMDIKELLNRTDRFAAKAGCKLTEVDEHHAVAVMTVTENHLNGGNVCQGGALFTLADLAFAAVTNSRGHLSFGVQSSITFSQSARLGDHLIAECVETFPHHRLPYCEVKVRNQEGKLICSFTGMAYSKSDQALPVEGLM